LEPGPRQPEPVVVDMTPSWKLQGMAAGMVPRPSWKLRGKAARARKTLSATMAATLRKCREPKESQESPKTPFSYAPGGFLPLLTQPQSFKLTTALVRARLNPTNKCFREKCRWAVSQRHSESANSVPWQLA
jgi:hypothetical protein